LLGEGPLTCGGGGFAVVEHQKSDLARKSAPSWTPRGVKGGQKTPRRFDEKEGKVKVGFFSAQIGGEGWPYTKAIHLISARLMGGVLRRLTQKGYMHGRRRRKGLLQ